MNSIYICDSYYHLLITIIKNIKNKGKNDLIIASESYNNTLINDKTLIKKLTNKKVFKNIYFFDYSKEQIKNNNKNKVIRFISNYILLQKINRKYKFDFSNYEKIYLYLDTGLVGNILNKRNIKYYLIEDGLDCYKKNYTYLNKSKVKRIIKKLVYGYEGFVSSKNIISIEVNSIDGITIKSNKFIEVSREEMFNKLSDEEKKEICEIFLNDLSVLNLSNYSMIITQPLHKDGLVETEEKQVELYKDIIKKYLRNDKIIIKVHPRDKINYKKYFKECLIIDKPFPIELFNFYPDIRFDKVISISSTSVDFLKNAKSKITLGWEWLNENKK